MPIYQHNKLKRELNKLEIQGIIKKSQFDAPCFVKEKPNGELRILIEYRELNAISEPFQNNFPSIFDAFHKMIGCTSFSKFYLEKGYYQIKIKEEDCSKTGFVTPFGIY